MAKVNKLVGEAARLVLNDGKSVREAAFLLYDVNTLGIAVDTFRKQIAKAVKNPPEDPVFTETKTKNKKDEPKPFVLSAWDFDTGKMMDIVEYCTHYNLPYDRVLSYKLVTHTGTPFYNTLFKDSVGNGAEIDFEALKDILRDQLDYKFNPISNPFVCGNREGVLKWADLHFGAHIRNLLLTHDYDSDILRQGLFASVEEVNRRSFSKTHVHICGDLIESLSGLNHINSWMSMDKEQIGANAIKLCCKLLHDALSQVVNLGKIKIVGGNHDRLSKDNDEDVKAGAADLIAWGLDLLGYDVEFHPYVICHQVEGINHINLHGDKGISKKDTKDILWKYGKKGCFNFVFEAHLHSIIEKVSTSQRDKLTTITDDGVDHRRMHLPSFFTGNYYSETLGYNSNAGYVIIDDNGKGKPQVFTGAV